MRTGGLAVCEARPIDGVIASSQGKPSVAPAPRNKVFWLTLKRIC